MTKKIKQFSIFLFLSIFGAFLFLVPNALAISLGNTFDKGDYTATWYGEGNPGNNTTQHNFGAYDLSSFSALNNFVFMVYSEETTTLNLITSVSFGGVACSKITVNPIGVSGSFKTWFYQCQNIPNSSGQYLTVNYSSATWGYYVYVLTGYDNVGSIAQVSSVYYTANCGGSCSSLGANSFIPETANGLLATMTWGFGGETAGYSSRDVLLAREGWAGWYNTYVSLSSEYVGTDGVRFANSSTGINGFILEFDVAVPPSNLEITSPAGSMSINGLSVSLQGTCESLSGGWIKQLMVGTGSFLPVIDGNCDCKDNVFDCPFVAPTYGTYEITVIDWQNYDDVDTITLSFVQNNINWLDYFSYTYGLTSSASTTESSPVDIYQDDGFEQDSVPLYFHFSPASVASSTALEFRLWNFFDNDMVEVASGTLASLGITTATTTLGYSFNLVNATTTNLIATLNKLNGDEVQKNFIELVWHASPRLVYPNISDMGTYFPRIKETLDKKILFHQFFQIYDTLLNSFNSFDGSATKFSVNANFMTDDGEYGLAIPVLDLSTPTALEFATPLRSFFRGLLIVLFGVWFMLRIFKITSWPG